jgi:putative transposase
LPNHYHFLIRQDSEQAGELLPQRIFNSYSKAYNKRYDHSGTLFESQYKVITVHTESYVLDVCRYIHANPVKHGIVNDLREWPYSNYLEWIEERSGTLVDRDFVRLYYPTPEEYRETMLVYLQQREQLAALTYLEEY